MIQSRVELLIKSIESGIEVEKNLNIKIDDFGFGLQYSIDDTRTPDKGNSSYSKSIKLPGDDNNNKLLGLLYDVNVDFTYYNPNIKIEARIVINGTTVLKGFLQLKNIEKLNTNDLQGNKIEYTVVVFSDNVDFLSELGEKKLEDLDLSDLNHIYNYTNINNSWTNTWRDTYLYPMMDSGNVPYRTTDFKPAFFHKALLYRIADDANFSIGGSFLDDSNNPIYSKEIIPYNGDIPRVSEVDALTREFKVGWTSAATLLSGNDIWTTSAKFQSQAKRFAIPDSSTSPFYDTSGGYNSGTVNYNWTDANGNVATTNGNGWIANKTGKYNFSGAFNIDLKIVNTSTSTIYQHTYLSSDPANTYSINNKMKHRILLYIFRNNPNSGVPASAEMVSVGDWQELPLSIAGSATLNINHSMNFSFPDIQVGVGHIIQLKMAIESYNVDTSYVDRFFYSTISNSNNMGVAFNNVIFNNYSIISNSPLVGSSVNPFYKNETVRVGGVIDDQIIEPTDYLPKNFLQKDLFIDLIRRYNLYMYPDPNNTKRILLETRDDYYNNETTIKDWTDKKDYNSPDKIQFLSELKNKEMLFTYKDDSSSSSNGGKYNDLYKKSTGDIYGQKRINFNNDFISGEKKIESPFSPTPMRYRESLYVVVPTIDSTIPKCKPRVLYYGGLKTPKDTNLDNKTWTFTYINNLGVDVTTTLSQYPYCGHWDDPINPTIDLNFGEVGYSWDNILTTMTDNNLYTRYWRNYINQISEGKLITSYFNLNEIDINDIKDNLNYKIFIKDSYYYINNIIDYNPILNTLTKVELLKITDGVKFETGNVGQTSVFNNADAIVMSKGGGQNNGIGSVTLANNNFTNSKTRSNTTLIVGDYNKIGNTVSKSLTLGTNNKIFNGVENGVILASNNSTVIGGVKNGVIIGSNNKVITQSNEIWLGNIHIINGVIQNSANLIDGGENELRTLYPTNEQNLIDGGENEIRTSFPQNLSNLIDGNVQL